MSIPTRPRFEPRGRGGGPSRLGMLYRVAWFGLIAFGIYWFAFRPRDDAKPNPVAQAPPQAKPFTPESAQGVELATAASIQRQQLTAAKFTQRQAIAAFDELTRDFAAWEQELAAWQRDGIPLLRSDDGKRLAADAALTRRFRTIFRQERPGAEDLAAARRQAEELVSPIRESIANPEDASTPSEVITTTLRELQTQARKAREGYREAGDAVRVLLAGAPAAGEKTLEQAITEADREDALERVATIEAEEKKAREEGTRLIAEEKARLIQTESEAEAQRLRDEAAKKKQASDLAAARTVEEMEVRQREADQEIARLRDEAERKRQGALTTGSVWRGSSHFGNVVTETTLTVVSRSRDDVQVTLTSKQPGSGGPTYSFAGTVRGNVLRLKGSDVLTPYGIEATYQPSSETISGRFTDAGGSPGSFSVRLDRGERADGGR